MIFQFSLYALIILVNCTWNDWVFGECSTTCGIGIRVDKRTIKSEEIYGGYCDPFGDRREEKCKVADCPGIKQ